MGPEAPPEGGRCTPRPVPARIASAWTPQTTRAERRGSTAQLGRYRDGLLLPGKSAGTPEDELLYVLDRATTVDIVEKDGPQSFTVSAGMLAVVPQGAWHRVHSADGRTVMSAKRHRQLGAPRRLARARRDG
jgi:hypothetical protein